MMDGKLAMERPAAATDQASPAVTLQPIWQKFLFQIGVSQPFVNHEIKAIPDIPET